MAPSSRTAATVAVEAAKTSTVTITLRPAKTLRNNPVQYSAAMPDGTVSASRPAANFAPADPLRVTIGSASQSVRLHLCGIWIKFPAEIGRSKRHESLQMPHNGLDAHRCWCTRAT